MKQTIVFSVGALNQLPLDWEGNRQRILAAIAQASVEGSTLVCLPGAGFQSSTFFEVVLCSLFSLPLIASKLIAIFLRF